MEILVLCSGAQTKAKSCEYDRAMEAVKMDDGHLEWKEKGSPISGNGAVFLFFTLLSHLCRKVLGRGPREKGSATPLAGLGAGRRRSSLRRTTYGQVWPGAGWNAEEKECS